MTADFEELPYIQAKTPEQKQAIREHDERAYRAFLRYDSELTAAQDELDRAMGQAA